MNGFKNAPGAMVGLLFALALVGVMCAEPTKSVEDIDTEIAEHEAQIAALRAEKLKTAGITTEWTNWPVLAREYDGIDPGIYPDSPPPALFARNDIVIGFRSDGVVVWRQHHEPPER